MPDEQVGLLPAGIAPYVRAKGAGAGEFSPALWMGPAIGLHLVIGASHPLQRSCVQLRLSVTIDQAFQAHP